MTEARGKYEWQHTSALMALIVNLLRNPKKSKAVKPSDFNPYLAESKPKVMAPLSILKEVWVRK